MAYPKKIKDNTTKELIQYILDKLRMQKSVQSITGTFVDNTDALNPVIALPYKSYKALITQSGTDKPTAVVLENSIGTVSFQYISAGIYRLITSNFNVNKVSVDINQGRVDSTRSLVGAFYGGGGVTEITSIANVTPTNGILNKTSIEIKVYN